MVSKGESLSKLMEDFANDDRKPTDILSKSSPSKT